MRKASLFEGGGAVASIRPYACIAVWLLTNHTSWDCTEFNSFGDWPDYIEPSFMTNGVSCANVSLGNQSLSRQLNMPTAVGELCP